ncbi:Serine/threonine-protein kinase AFC1 [Ananas comosus]|uniref:Serine/threonine-protein kinase AFC1 n=1 Tax=Ananas comosus TaxID=4615 RepID=A0A199UMW7_ANACO|nr:Serine/threonine-protein kinase AFC1 [Ananas comosus]
METQWISDFAHPGVDKRPRKRPRLNWDVPPPLPPPKALQMIYCSQEIANGTITNHFMPAVYYTGVPRNISPPWRPDDKDGHYVFAIGENLTPRYRILSKMGEGTFGQVVECWDLETKETVAIKIVRSLQKYREAAMIEIDVLQKLAKHDFTGTRCVQIRNWFDYRNHICIVFEKLGPSLYDFLRKNSYRSFPIDLVRELGRQILESVAFMHDLRLIHTDLKPENILLVSSDCIRVPDYKVLSRSAKGGSFFKNLPKSSAIKLIDFGSTTFEHQDHSYVVSTRHYRAPEVILGLGWNYPCDLWSVGCILVELCSNLVMQHVDHSAGDLIDLLQGLFRYDPNERMKAREALRHPFFTKDHRRYGYLN